MANLFTETVYNWFLCIKPREAKIWCYVTGISSITLLDERLPSLCHRHPCPCPEWPPHLISQASLAVQCSNRYYSTVLDEKTNEEFILCSTGFDDGQKGDVSGLWKINNRILVPSALTSWKGCRSKPVNSQVPRKDIGGIALIVDLLSKMVVSFVCYSKWYFYWTLLSRSVIISF